MSKSGRTTKHHFRVTVVLAIIAAVSPSATTQQSKDQVSAETRCRLRIAKIVYEPVSSLRSIDFKNYTYPGASDCDMDLPTRTFRIQRGQYGDASAGLEYEEVKFGDVSGDGDEEALVTLAVRSDGNMERRAVYIFTLVHKQPRVIHIFESGDRAQGGLRKAYAENGRFILELWGPGNTLDSFDNVDKVGLCCPATFRSRYRWSKSIFHQDGVFEVLPNPRANTSCPTCDN